MTTAVEVVGRRACRRLSRSHATRPGRADDDVDALLRRVDLRPRESVRLVAAGHREGAASCRPPRASWPRDAERPAFDRARRSGQRMSSRGRKGLERAPRSPFHRRRRVCSSGRRYASVLPLPAWSARRTCCGGGLGRRRIRQELPASLAAEGSGEFAPAASDGVVPLESPRQSHAASAL